MIITNSNQLHYHLYEFMEDKMCFRKLKSMILLHKLKRKKTISARFRQIFDFELKGKRSSAHLCNSQGGWNKRGWGPKVVELLTWRRE